MAFAAVLLIPVDDASADHGNSAVTDLTVGHPSGTVIEWDLDYIELCVEHNLCGPKEHGFAHMEIIVNNNNYNGFTEKRGGFRDDGSCIGGPSDTWCPPEIQFIKVGYAHYTVKLDTTGYPDGNMNIEFRYEYLPNSTYQGGADFTIASSFVDLIDPVITIPELTTDQWGNENLELSMSGTTNFPTGSWTVTATDNVGVIDSACWAPAGGMDDPGDPWDSNTQSYDFSKITNPPSGQKFAIGSTSISCAAYDAAGNNGWANFNVVVTHDDPTGFVQYIDQPNSFGNTADSTSKIFYSANSAQSLHLLKPIADLLTESNTQGMLARDATRILMDGALTLDDNPNNFYTGGQYTVGNTGYGIELPKPLADMLTDENMAGIENRVNPTRSWSGDGWSVEISEDISWLSPLNAMVKICNDQGGCQENHVMKPFADMLNESNLNQAMFERSNMKILDAGGPAASAPQSSADTTPSQSYTVLVNEMRGSIAANDPGGCASFNPQTCYTPSDITINVGDSVTWVNNDPTNNWYTLMGNWGGLASSSGDNACDGPGKLNWDMCGTSGNDRTSWTHTFDTVGTFNYHDWVYQNSSQRPEGVVNVVASGASTPVAVSVLVAAAEAEAAAQAAAEAEAAAQAAAEAEAAAQAAAEAEAAAQAAAEAEAVAAAQAAAELAAAASVDQVTIGALEDSGFSQSCVETGCYTPVNATSVVGGVVTMTNTDPTGVHTFTSGTVNGFAPSPDGTFDTGVLMSGDAFEWVPEAAGEQPYYCMLHTWMVGTIIVQTVEEAAAAQAAAEAAAAQAAAAAAAAQAAAQAAEAQAAAAQAAAQVAAAVNATTTTPSATTTTPSATTTTPSATTTTPSTPTDNSITVKTNRETFTQGNPIVVFGKVSQTVNDDVISLKISKDGNVIHNQDFKPTTKGDFTKLVTTSGNMWNDSGNYRIDVSYDGAISLTNFYLASNPSVLTNSTSSTSSTNSTSTPSINSTSANEQNNVTPQTESQNELKLSLNKENFKVGETITIRASLDSIVSEQNVAVSVIDPNNKNVVSRTITIENSDQSNLQFKLVDNSASGTYLVKITSLINGQTISDSTEFTVVSSNSGVEIVSIEPTDQQGNPVTEFTKNKMGFVKVVLSAENPINSLVTVNLFDSEFTSLGVGSFKTQLSGEHEIILSFFTPEFATIGNGEIYANVFSEWPSVGGIPLTGESSSQVILK